MSGIFISFEGIDFSGKSEQCRRLTEGLRKTGYDNVELLREPGGVAIAEAIRKILLDASNIGMSTRTELLLYSAARAQITNEKIIPLLQAGKIIIADRYADSTTVYQGVGRRLDSDFIQAVNRFATQNTKPDVTFLIDLPVEVAKERQLQAGLTRDRLESEKSDFHERVRQAYLQIARNEATRFMILDGTQSAEKVATEVAEKVRERFKLNL